MECADDIAYAVHDLEDIVARRLVLREDLQSEIDTRLGHTEFIGLNEKGVKRIDFVNRLFRDSYERKEVVGRLVNLFVTEVRIERAEDFTHPLLKYRLRLPPELSSLLETLRNLTLNLVIKRAEVQQLEHRGMRIVSKIYTTLKNHPEALIPRSAWNSLDPDDNSERRVCDYVAGMTDQYAERVYHRLFTPGFGSSGDEL
jgi:dGTPase